MDPSRLPDSMVSSMARRERSHRAPQRFHGPLPEQSAFVAAAAAAIPQPTVTTQMNIGRIERGEGSQPASRGKKMQQLAQLQVQGGAEEEMQQLQLQEHLQVKLAHLQVQGGASYGCYVEMTDLW